MQRPSIGHLSRRQRVGLLVLAILNVGALFAIAILFARTPSSKDAPLYTLLVEPAELRDCRQSASQALLQAGQSGLVNALGDGSILIQIQRALNARNPRSDADAAIWTAFEAVANSSGCHGFATVFVTAGPVDVTTDASNPSKPQPTNGERATTASPNGVAGTEEPPAQVTRAEARARMADLLRWSRGQLDDAEFASRIEYTPPTIPSVSD
jgi:hypothetical protein